MRLHICLNLNPSHVLPFCKDEMARNADTLQLVCVNSMWYTYGKSEFRYSLMQFTVSCIIY